MQGLIGGWVACSSFATCNIGKCQGGCRFGHGAPGSGDDGEQVVLSGRDGGGGSLGFCIASLQEALHRFDSPEIFNTDQGSPFTSQAFIAILKAHPIRIRIDGRGRAADNIFVDEDLRLPA